MKKISYVILLWISLLVFPMGVFAQEDITLSVSKKSAQSLDEITVTAKINSEQKWYALTAALSYDENVFEAIDERNLSAMDRWSDVQYNKETQKFGIMNKSSEISGQLLKVKLKVKENATAGKTSIRLTNISASDGKKKYSLEKTSVEVLITKDASQNEVMQDPTKEEEKESEQEITMVANGPVLIGIELIVVLLVLILIAIHVYNWPKKKIFTWILLPIIILLTGVLIFMMISNEQKKDVNQDGVRDYEDAKEIIKYLIDVKPEVKQEEENSSSTNKPTNENQNPNVDYNNNGVVDIVDAAQSVEDTTKQKYTVTLSEFSKSSVYAEKNTEITLDFFAQINPKETIKEVKINGQNYPVVNNTTHYSVHLKTNEESGVKEYVISEVTLSNGRVIKTNLKIKRDILKDIPYVEDFKVDEDQNTISFQVKDQDHALLDGKITLFDSKEEVVFEEKIQEGENIYSYDFKKEEKYQVSILASYDLDTDQLNLANEDQNEVWDSILLEKEIMIKDEYHFFLSDLYIDEKFTKGDAPILYFRSSNQTSYRVEKIKINGQEYTVLPLEMAEIYQVVLPPVSEFGSFSLNIEQITLENGKAFQNHKDFEAGALPYNVLKIDPTINDLELTDQKEEKMITASFTINDEDQAITKLVAVLTDGTKKELERKEVEGNTVSFSYDEINAMKFTITLLADYDLGTEEYQYVEQNLASKEIIVEPNIFIRNVAISKTYPKKNEIMYLTYDIVVPKDYGKKVSNLITGITINGLNYSATRTSANDVYARYEISFTTPNKAGVLPLETNQIMFADGTFVEVSNQEVLIDVLKDQPQIENFRIEKEDYDQKEVTFSFEVKEDLGGFESGYLTLNGQEEKINKGKNTITIHDLPQDTELTLQVHGHFDLDSNELETDKNEHQDTVIFEMPYILQDPKAYESIAIDQFEAFSTNNTIYFEKQEEIYVNVKPTDLSVLNTDLDKIIVNKKEYPVSKYTDIYTAFLDGYDESGPKTLSIEAIVLTNGRQITLKNPKNLTIEVLKDPIQITEFKYQVMEQEIKVSTRKIDEEDSLDGKITLKVVNELGQTLGTYDYQEEITFPKVEKTNRYNIQVIASFDRDHEKGKETPNYDQDRVLLDEMISLEENYMEIKNIMDVVLYKNENGNVVEVSNISKTKLEEDLDSYFVKMVMSSMPAIYSPIKRVEVKDEHLYLILENEKMIMNSSEYQKELEIDFGPIHDDIAVNEMRPESFESLMKKIALDPEGTFTLDHDLDASEYQVSTQTYTEIEFKGTLDGNGYTIKNISKPLFKTMNNAEVKNLHFINVLLTSGEDKGVFASSASQSKFSNILIDGLEKSGGKDGFGSFVGSLNNNSLIENSKVSGLKIYNSTYSQSIGGLVGTLNHSKITDTYVIGLIQGGWHFIGGIAGNSSNNAEISNSYTKVTINSEFGDEINSGIIAGGGRPILKNNISLSTGSSGYRISNSASEAENNYQIKESNLKENDQEGFITISKDEINETFFKEHSNWQETIWNFKDASYDHPPTLQIEFQTGLSSEAIKENETYDEEKRMLYANLNKLSPIFDSNRIIENGQNISKEDLLNKEEIIHILPLDQSGEIVNYLTQTDTKKIRKIKVIFSNEEVKEYEVKFDKIYNNIAAYRISALQIDYTYNHYVIDSDSQLIKDLLEYLNQLDYTQDLQTLTTTPQSRIYRDYYNEVTKKELKEFLLKYLSNGDTNYTSDLESVRNYIKKDLTSNNKLKKALFVYNYFRRWYSVEINQVNLNDLVFFHSEGFNDILTAQNITEMFFQNEANFATAYTNDTYKRIFEKYTNITTLPRFLEYYVTKLSTETPDEWYKNSFKGKLREVNIEGREDITYTLWSHIKYEDIHHNVWHNYALVLLTMPPNSTYIVSSPTQFLLGSERIYIKNPNDPQDQKILDEKLDAFVERIKTFYKTTESIIIDAKYFNELHTIQLDRRLTLDASGKQVYQSPYVTEEEFHKNFNEVVNKWKEMDGNAATANGTDILWNAEAAIESLHTYSTWSHETAHNMDSRLFLKQYGRRWDAGGEDYSDGNINQIWGDGNINMNLTFNYSQDVLTAANWTTDRINSPDKIYSYYRKLFETIYVLDYLEAQAFVQLTPEEQAKLAVQVTYPEENNPDQKLKYKTTRYLKVDQSEYEKWDLKNVYDLYDHRIVIYPTVTYSTIIDNRYGSENIYKTRWYAPHNDYGRPDSYSLKYFAFEMLGYKGYEKGYIEYYSNIHANADGSKTDLMALRTITEDPTMTFEKYRKQRFEYVEKNIQYVQYIDANQIVKDFYNALKEDAKNEKSENVVRSTDVRRKVFYDLKKTTNDFRKEIYDFEHPKNIQDFTILD